MSAHGLESDPRRGGPWVYFIQAGEGGPIKIGFTAGNPRERMATLQIGNAAPLALIGAARGTFEDEQRIHERFDSARIRGEWFRPAPDLLAFIGGFCWRAPPPPIVRERARLACGLTFTDLHDIWHHVEARRMMAAALPLLMISNPGAEDVAEAAALLSDLGELLGFNSDGIKLLDRDDTRDVMRDLRAMTRDDEEPASDPEGGAP